MVHAIAQGAVLCVDVDAPVLLSIETIGCIALQHDVEHIVFVAAFTSALVKSL